MFVQQSPDGGMRLVTSASDLTAASMCEFAFLRRVDARLGRAVIVPDNDDVMLARAAQLGDTHEERVLQSYIAEFGRAADNAQGVVEIARADSRDAAVLSAAEEATVAALRAGAEVVFQATFFDPQQVAATPHDPTIAFIGYADFLRRTRDGSYEVQDTKLARSAKVTALMQLAAYAEQLERLGVAVAPEATLILGDGAHSTHKLADIAPVFRARRSRLHQVLLERVRAVGADGRRESAAPIAWGDTHISVCGRCEVCEPEVQKSRDVLLIAGMRLTQRERLRNAGISTIDQVAASLAAVSASTLKVNGISQAVLERLAMQAAEQVRATVGAPPPFRVINSQAFAAIPEPNPGDLFFDFEGDPLYRAPGDETAVRWGLDYLFGMVDSQRNFTPIWAHDLDAERAALEQFIAFVVARREQHPGMHIYHYAPYERTHLLSIAARHATCEAEVDQLMRERVLVDLYPIVRNALRIGSRSYSIKKLEPLYMGDELRAEDGVVDGAQSVAEYAEAQKMLLSADAHERERAVQKLEAIADYNRYDCVSTLELRNWLLERAREHGVTPFAGPAEDLAAEGAEPELQPSPVAVALARHAERADNPEDRQAAALAGSSIDYYQREQKSFWREHFARLVNPIEDWADTKDVMVVDEPTSEVTSDWQPPEGRQRNYRRTLRLRGEFAPGSSVKEGGEVYVIYDHEIPFPLPPRSEPGSRGARLLTVAERHDDGITVVETRAKDLDEWQVLPVAVAPGPPPRAGAQKEAIEQWGGDLAQALDNASEFADPVFDVMRRTPPRLLGRTELVRPDSQEARDIGGSDDARFIGAVIGSLRALDRSTLAVQGPPGTGKTYLAARVIRTLVERDGWRIGVVAQSHKVVENVLEGVVKAGLDPAQVAKVPQGGKLEPGAPQPGYTVLAPNQHQPFIDGHRAQGRGAVIGGTAWDFANESRAPRRGLDLLVIDEAGQFSLAPTIASAMAAERLLLLGDPQQLPQVSQGTHPEPVDESALGWLLGHHKTLPDDRGYFLAETRRMRPELTDVVSELSYENRLSAHPSAALREASDAGLPGLIWHPISHRGNATSSSEEAAEVVRLITRLLAGQITEPGQAQRPLSEHDVIVVAAYNAQVECLSIALAEAALSNVRVGTVDRFQGQEAAIAIVSLAASSGEDVPRGLDFLLMRNRLNVAISRAQWAAHLVSSEQLGMSLPSTAEGVEALSGYLRLTERATKHIQSSATSANV